MDVDSDLGSPGLDRHSLGCALHVGSGLEDLRWRWWRRALRHGEDPAHPHADLGGHLLSLRAGILHRHPAGLARSPSGIVDNEADPVDVVGSRRDDRVEEGSQSVQVPDFDADLVGNLVLDDLGRSSLIVIVTDEVDAVVDRLDILLRDPRLRYRLEDVVHSLRSLGLSSGEGGVDDVDAENDRCGVGLQPHGAMTADAQSGGLLVRGSWCTRLSLRDDGGAASEAADHHRSQKHDDEKDERRIRCP